MITKNITPAPLIAGPQAGAVPVILILLMMTLSGCGTGTAERTARAYGIGRFDDVTKITFTFNVLIKGKIISRRWEWEPKEKKVTFFGDPSKPGEKEITYYQDRVGSGEGSSEAIDRMFVNDRYWLLFPFHLKWDRDADVKDTGVKEYPLGGGKGRRLEVRYPSVGGYTPGDMYELYLDDDYMIRQWVYRKGGGDPTRITSWDKNEKFGKMVISTERVSSDGSFKVWFTGIDVKFAGKE